MDTLFSMIDRPKARPAKASPGQPPRHDAAALVEWLRGQTWSDFARSLAEQHDRTGSLTARQYEAACRMRAKCEARDAARATQRSVVAPPEPEVGLYKVGSGIYKVQANRAGTSRYAKVLCADGEWEYVGKRPFSLLTPAARLTRDEAARYGRTTGRCACCGRTLTNEESIARGIGPICLEHFG